RFVLRSGEILMQNRAMLRHALRIALGIFPSGKRAMQRSGNLRNSLGVNYKSAALNQLSYAGAAPYKSCFQRVDQEFVTPFRAPRCKRDQNFTVLFYGVRNDLGLPWGAGSS